MKMVVDGRIFIVHPAPARVHRIAPSGVSSRDEMRELRELEMLMVESRSELSESHRVVEDLTSFPIWYLPLAIMVSC